MSVFKRHNEHLLPTVSAPRVAGALLHLSFIPFAGYLLNGGAADLLNYLELSVIPIGERRAHLMFALYVLYCIRWCVGCIVMSGSYSLVTALSISLVHCVFVIILPVFGVLWGGGLFDVPLQLTPLDYVGGALAALACVQHVAETQRWLFKMDRRNRGRLHTSGLFGLARYINHTGHVMNDVAFALLSRSVALAFGLLFIVHLLVFQVTPETNAHLEKKYGHQFTEYVKRTPYQFIIVAI